MANTVRTTCPYCGVGCGVLVTPEVDGTYSVAGDPEHPANFGRLCSKGTALGETLSDDGRLLEPLVDGKAATWDSALGWVADEFQAVIDEHGPDAVAFYVSGQLMTEAYYVANKLMKGFIGSANIDTNSRLCMASSVAGHKRTFGSDTVPGNYEDFELADLVVLVGSNLAWCHPVLYQRLSAAKKERGTKVVVIDPRKTATCDIADLHLRLKPGTDVALFNGLLTYLSDRGPIDTDFSLHHADGMTEALAAAVEDAPSVERVANSCDVGAGQVREFYELFRTIHKTVTVYSQGVNQSIQGTDKVSAILNCHLFTGRIGKPGAGPFSVTGQPNAMGGREVGGLANTLAAHMDFDESSVSTVSKFWNAPAITTGPGLKAVDMFDAVHDGCIKAIWIMATNPVVSMPNADKVREALDTCPFVVVSDCMPNTDTAKLADVLLPATTWGERDGTVTNSERRISRQRPFKPAPGEAREDWDIVCDVAKRMGYAEAFAFNGPAEIFAEHAALSAFENSGSRDFDLSGLCDLSVKDYDALSPIQWPVINGFDSARLLGDGRFFTANAKAQFQAPRNLAIQDHALILNSGRLRDQWHTMTRTGVAGRLTAHTEEPFIALHPIDAERLNVTNNSIVRASSSTGQALARASVDESQRPGEAFMPIHWSRANSAQGGVGPLASALSDPYSGQPDMKNTPVKVEAYNETWHALVVTRQHIDLGDGLYWAQAQADAHVRTVCAGHGDADQALVTFKDHLGNGEWMEFTDPARGRLHAAKLIDGKLIAAVFIVPNNIFPERGWLDGLFGEGELKSEVRPEILAGRAPGGQSAGRTVCACLGVGINTIVHALENGQAMNVEGLGALLGAGTSCGSCRPELQDLVNEVMSSNHAGERVGVF